MFLFNMLYLATYAVMRVKLLTFGNVQKKVSVFRRKKVQCLAKTLPAALDNKNRKMHC